MQKKNNKNSAYNSNYKNSIFDQTHSLRNSSNTSDKTRNKSLDKVTIAPKQSTSSARRDSLETQKNTALSRKFSSTKSNTLQNDIKPKFIATGSNTNNIIRSYEREYSQEKQ